MQPSKTYLKVLTIAGSDPSGGAGIQADIKTISALGLYAMSVITAVTAQNTCGVLGYEPMSDHMLAQQLDAVFTDIVPDAVKIGMIPTPQAAEIIAKALRKYRPANVVLDPVAVSTSRHSLTELDTPQIVASQLFPLATIITPNAAEAALYLNKDLKEVEKNLVNSAVELLEMGPENVLLTGGDTPDLRNNLAVDYFATRGAGADEVDVTKQIHPYTPTANTHGTGCTLSSAIACYLAIGQKPLEAVGSAIRWTSGAIEYGAPYQTGHGRGPVNHLFQNVNFQNIANGNYSK